MGYVFVRTGVFQNAGAMMKGMSVAKEIAQYLKTTQGSDARLMAPAWSGCGNRVSWVMTHDSLSGFFDLLGKALADEKYGAMVTRLSDHIDGRLTRDQIWREVPTASSGKARPARYSTVRSVTFKNLGAMAGGLQEFKQICDYVLKTQDAATRLYVPVMGGAVSRAIMVRNTDDLDSAQTTMDKVMSDDKFRPMLQRLIEYVDGSRTQDALWRVVQ